MVCRILCYESCELCPEMKTSSASDNLWTFFCWVLLSLTLQLQWIYEHFSWFHSVLLSLTFFRCPQLPTLRIKSRKTCENVACQKYKKNLWKWWISKIEKLVKTLWAKNRKNSWKHCVSKIEETPKNAAFQKKCHLLDILSTDDQINKTKN